ncbi:YsnF/AvaK domain-containing protein [Deinococcus sp. SM5_A1]|uniref:YsnF/AvaK domain-containing protein n=1 Tax=Deinococcus sp. SM5_A1 TaxID=3379094 RepID=UPI00385D101F
MTDPRKDKFNEPLTASELETQAVQLADTQLQGVIELREERLIVEKEREVAGSVAFTREVRRETVQMPVELVTEVLIIEHLGTGAADGGHTITLDGTPLAPGERRELLVYREEARIEKRVVVREQVSISKRQVIETRTFDATLAREELVVNPEGDVQVFEQPAGEQKL